MGRTKKKRKKKTKSKRRCVTCRKHLPNRNFPRPDDSSCKVCKACCPETIATVCKTKIQEPLPNPFTNLRFGVGDKILAFHGGKWIEGIIERCHSDDAGNFSAYKYSSVSTGAYYTAARDTDDCVRVFTEENILQLDSTPDPELMLKEFPKSKVVYL